MNTHTTTTAHPITVVDPTYIDPTAVSEAISSIDPFGVVRSAVARVRGARDRRRLALAERTHRRQTERLLATDHRMRAEWEAHFFTF